MVTGSNPLKRLEVYLAINFRVQWKITNTYFILFFPFLRIELLILLIWSALLLMEQNFFKLKVC